MKKLALIVFLALQIPLFAQKNAEYQVAAIGFYNLENLFDTLDNPATNDADFLPKGKYLWDSKTYAAKSFNMARVVSGMATEISPDGVAVLGVAEVENRQVLEDLVAQPSLRDRNYQIVHFDSPDERGIDCGLLYQTKYFQVTAARPVHLNLVDPLSGEADKTRDILFVSGVFNGEPMHIMVGHWPSRRGGEKSSAWARAAAAAMCRQLADSLLTADPNAKIIVMGDLNDDPTNKSVHEVLNAQYEIKGMAPMALYNTMYDHYKNGNGTLAYRDSWNLFDQIIISRAMTGNDYNSWQFYKSIVFKQPFMMENDGQYKGYPLRTLSNDVFINGYSDHFPVYILLLKKK